MKAIEILFDERIWPVIVTVAFLIGWGVWEHWPSWSRRKTT